MAKNNFLYRNIPNFFTLMNLLSGAIAIVLTFEGRDNLILASYFIYIAGVFDFFDGFAARNLKVTSLLGKELDSLADMVSFGLAPSMILYQLLKQSQQIKQFSFSLPSVEILIVLSAFLIAIFSAIRLAKFNIDENQTETFMGLATPACAMLIAAIPLIAEFNPNDLILFPDLSKNTFFFFSVLALGVYTIRPIVLLPLIVILSILLVAKIPMFSLKFKNYKFEHNKLKYIFLIFSVISFVSLQILAVPIIFLIYISFSIFNNIFNKNIKVETNEPDEEVEMLSVD
ncbi:MAG: CDP-alcohol phosphatidyltransferase family protein [Bacteroidota bacterium]